MSTLVDSEAYFRHKLTELGLREELIGSLVFVDHGLRTLSQLSFAIGQPGQPFVNQDFEDLVRAAANRAATIDELSALKRAAFEAHTFVIATLRQSVEATDDSEVKKVPAVERTSRVAF